MLKKRSLLAGILAVIIVFLFLLAGCANEQKNESNKTESTVKEQVYTHPEQVSADDAVKLLQQGNERYKKSETLKKNISSKRLQDLLKGQKPFAVIVSCSDSRVPPELVFDQGLGDIFIIRVAGNVIDPVTMGSIEYAVEHLKSPLVVVMGHEKCGAVTAAVQGGETPGSIGSIVDLIKPAVDKTKQKGLSGDQLVEESAKENVVEMEAKIKESPVVKELEESGKLKVVGANYHIGSGNVEWIEAK